MSEGLIQGAISQDWRLVRVDEVIVRERQRATDPEHVKQLRTSFRELGGQLQLQPIVLDGSLVLIDGMHRLEAARQEGWEFISAVILDGVSEDERPLLEAEANRVRKALSPLEISEAWRRYYEPAFKARARNNQLSQLRRGNELPVHGNTVNGESDTTLTPVSMVVAARETTGMGLDWLNKIEDIRRLTQSETAPEALRAAAVKGLEKLKKPGTKVDPIHRELLAMQDVLARQGEDQRGVQARRLEQILDRTLSDTSLLAEKLGKQLGQELRAAVDVAPAGRESLRSIRVALSYALAEVIAVECLVEGDPRAVLERVGGEVTRLLSEVTVRKLGSVVDGE